MSFLFLSRVSPLGYLFNLARQTDKLEQNKFELEQEESYGLILEKIMEAQRQ